MHPYIPYLLSDILNAHQPENINGLGDIQQKTIEEELEEIEKWVEGEEVEHTFGYWCGLESDGFPPPAQLTDDEMEIICKAFEEMMFTWNISIDLPKALPQYLRYTFTIDILNEKTAIMSSGCVTFDYCSGYAPDCKFKEYCSCLNIWKELSEKDTDIDNSKNDLDINDEDYPF